MRNHVFYPIYISEDELKNNINSSSKKIDTKKLEDIISNLNEKNNNTESIRNIFN